jgi:hypothetical protein
MKQKKEISDNRIFHFVLMKDVDRMEWFEKLQEKVYYKH